ncbi:MAG TPA: (Fe-S)-binding protein [Patescibacteria group bacterium]|nr:(Fe-S)-binding protein [Patescibacteria group bacterium]
MNEKVADTASGPMDVTEDFLLCNRCGTCRSVCPVFLVLREEGASARGKVELAEAFFKGAEIDERKLQQVFDLCLHCMSCEESCPSGMRADGIIMAVRAEMARRGLIPRPKRFALRLLETMDNALFKAMRSLGIVRRAPLHGVGGLSPLRVFFPLLGWPRERFVPLPKDRPFLGSNPELFEASGIACVLPGPDEVRRIAAARGGTIDPVKAADLVGRIAVARERNLAGHRRAYFFVGHAVNHFFPEEAEAVVKMLNLLGIDVLVPHDQVCCGAPVYYAGDIDGARRQAARTLERFAGHRYDWIVTSCSSGGLMLKREFPRLFDLTTDGFFEIAWDEEMETFRRVPDASATRRAHPRAGDIYREYVKGKVYDINELLAELLSFHEEAHGLDALFGAAAGNSWDRGGSAEVGGPAKVPGGGASTSAGGTSEGTGEFTGMLPIVTYHHPCHLNRGQAVVWQPESLLRALPGHRYVAMQDADRCCGGGGTFTFMHADAAEEIAVAKLDAVGKVRPDVVATSCPVCRIQLMDMLHRRFVLQAGERGEEVRRIPVKTPVELLLEDLGAVVGMADAGVVA